MVKTSTRPIKFQVNPGNIDNKNAMVNCLVWVRIMVFNTTFNNISVILWQSVLLVAETGVPRENHLIGLQFNTNFSSI